MKKYLTLTSRAAIAAIATAGLCFISLANATDENKSDSDAKAKSKLSLNDKKFVKKAYRGGMEEVENGKVAKEKAKNDATKDVADKMVSDHTKANEDLAGIAKEENLDLSKIHVKAMSMSGDNFDKTYLTMLKKDHEKDIAEFEKEAADTGSGEDSDVKEFAKKTLPTLKEHLKMVEDALEKVK
jgi:putative membrane protein